MIGQRKPPNWPTQRARRNSNPHLERAASEFDINSLPVCLSIADNVRRFADVHAYCRRPRGTYSGRKAGARADASCRTQDTVVLNAPGLGRDGTRPCRRKAAGQAGDRARCFTSSLKGYGQCFVSTEQCWIP